MRKNYLIIKIGVLIISIMMSLKAQGNSNFEINIGLQPLWGPIGYDIVYYYYLPDIESYYFVPSKLFYSNVEGKWIGSTTLPQCFSSYDLYNGYKVVLNDEEPWRNHKIHKERYSIFTGRHDQQIIRDSRDKKYFVVKDHPEHANWKNQQNSDNHNQNSGKSSGSNKIFHIKQK